jgi:beta-glucosidase-like glycosyl hydrolase
MSHILEAPTIAVRRGARRVLRLMVCIPGSLKNGAGLTAYAPNVNLVHDPRWGRANEVMSEDPLLTGALVAAYVRGMQNNSGADLVNSGAPLLMAACCKHYAVYNVEDLPVDRTQFNADVSARDL